MVDSCIRLLELAAFEYHEIKQYTDRLMKALNELGLEKNDIDFAVDEWIPQYFDVSLLGVRKFIGALLREIIDIFDLQKYKEDGYKIIYGTVPSPVSLYISLKENNNQKVYVGTPDIFLTQVLGSFFNKLNTKLEKVDSNGLNIKCRHCALNRMRIYGILSEIIPQPDIIFSWGTNCDEAPKTDEYINCFYEKKWPFYIIQMPHDTHFEFNRDEMDDRIIFLSKQIKAVVDKLESDFNIIISSEQLSKGIKIYNRLSFKVQYLNNLICKADKVPLGGNELSIISSVLLMQFNTGIQYVEEAIDVLIKEIKGRIKNNEGVLPRGTPKLGCYFVPFCVPQIDRMFRENDVCLTFSAVVSYFDIDKNRLSKDDPFIIIAENWLKMPILNNMKYEADAIRSVIKRLNVDGIIFGFFDFDRWMGAHQKMLCSIINQEPGISAYYIDGDFWDNNICYSEMIRSKVENICSTIKDNLHN